jgi:hypothetical protein
MTIQGTIQQAPPNVLGFDINADVSAYATQFVQAGYHYCLRYIPFAQPIPSDEDLTTAEAEAILDAGLGLMVVQHPPFDFAPTGELGTQYGNRAVQYLQQIGIPPGLNVWCDLEGVVNSGQPVIDYCNEWCAALSGAGYVPGLYVGVGTGLNDQQLYDLAFQHYWAAYNTNQSIPVRGWQMQQAQQSTSIGNLSYDDDTTQTDALGGTALWLAAR